MKGDHEFFYGFVVGAMLILGISLFAGIDYSHVLDVWKYGV